MDFYLKNRVSGLVFGTLILFFIAFFPRAALSDQLDLAIALFEEGNWRGCRIESARVLSVHPGHEKALLLKALSENRLGKDNRESLTRLCDSASLETALIANYELGRTLWKSVEPEKALGHLKYSFENSPSKDLFLRSGCSLSIMLNQYPELADKCPAGLQMQLRSCSPLWSSELRTECLISPGKQKEAWTGKPGQWLISFYRSQIGPAIGQRCSLVPSCSEYGRQALRKHGILGLGLIGDRLVREPDVVGEKKSPIRIKGRWLYRDPLEAHDNWMK